MAFKWTPDQVDALGFYDFLVACSVAKQWLESEGERATALLKALLGR